MLARTANGLNLSAVFVDDEGREVPDVVLPLDTELWNAERTRYTVILDPGRVKKDILPNRRMGRPLHNGESITVVVTQDWLDASGTRLVSEFKHRYRVAAADEQPVHTADWRIAPPAAGTRDPVTVHLPEAARLRIAAALVECLARFDDACR